MTEGKVSLPAKRPMFRYYGGKWRQAPWIAGQLPPHHVYCEPFCGAASVLFHKAPSYCEVINDLNSDVVNCFTVAKHQPADLIRAVKLSPYAREYHDTCYDATSDPLERAARFIVRSYIGRGADAALRFGSFRGVAMQAGTHPAASFATFPDALEQLCARLAGVVIENLDAMECISMYDSPETLFYVDPPYLFSTRTDPSKTYAVEPGDDFHTALLSTLANIKGNAVLSGYDSDIYDDALPGWTKLSAPAKDDANKARHEIIWISPGASVQTSLFEGAP